ncbi:MAG: C25 family cysteine peptidase [Ignavibacteriales bacterium]|nr:MAG: hypothetical protein F9K26_10565 [Ignavibacteriaceae bacterium]MBW7873601.1 hypothetical protein [Ignavibacteria bacterium]MCZ2143831.1 C25 family cysteine peptidase [Ignavibacteriales bacterium]OQY69967.1 MAG: hypothetical protein B6D45_12045 [Ignavibacteriales bacterium UTCHB3]MBV6445898.1 hypothetical protein [Ignavibacteriaceae bacterium]
MVKAFARIFVIFVIFALQALPQKYTILEKTEDHITIKFDLRSFPEVKDTLVNGRKFSYFPGEGMYFMKQGEPAVPEYSVSAGINFSSKPKITVLASEKGRTETKFILPFTVVDSLTFEPDLIYFEKDVYNVNGYFPKTLARLDGRHSFRFSEIQPIIISPYQYNPVTRELVRYNSITVRLDYNIQYGGESFVVKPVEDPTTDNFLKNAVVNYDEARNWIGEKKELSSNSPATDETWYNPNKTWFKIYLNKRDIYKLTYEQLVQAGLPTNRQIEKKKLQMFSSKGEVPLAIYGGQDSIFSPGDYIIFAGDSLPPSPYTAMNVYNTSNLFWFSFEADSAGLRYQDRDGRITQNNPAVNYSLKTLHFEEDRIYERLGWAPNGLRDYWFWAKINAFRGVPQMGFAHRFNALPDIKGELPFLRVRAEIHGITTTVYPCNFVHSVNLYINDKKLANLKWNGQDKILYDSTFNIVNDTIVIASQGNEFKVVTDGDICLDDKNDELRVNWYELQYYKENRAAGKKIFIRNPEGVSGIKSFWVFNWTGDTMFVYLPDRAERIINPQIAHNQYGDVLFQDSVQSEKIIDYMCVDADYGISVDSIRIDTPSDLRNPNREADYIIIYHPKFKSIAERLANFRRSKPLTPGANPPRVFIADVLEIYDEFSNGLLDPEGIKSFLKYAFYNFKRPAPVYVTLLGDMSYDYRKILPDSRENFIPSFPFHSIQYGVAASDNAFVALSSTTVTPDMAISRFSIETVEEGNIVMDKLEGYPGDNTKVWRETALLMASGMDRQDELQFGFNRESIKLMNNFIENQGYRATIICRFPSTPEEEQYAGSTPEILTAFNRGAVLANYYGHGGGYQWDLTFTNNHIYQLENQARLPFVISVTCYTAHFDNQDVFGEQFIKVPGKGAIGFFGSSGLTHWQIGTYINGLMFDEMFNMKNHVTGLSILASKVRTPPIGYYANQIALLTYLGEVGLSLALPNKPDFAITNSDITFSPTNPLKGDTMFVQVKLSNYGIKIADSVDVELRFAGQDTSGIIETVRIPIFTNSDSLTFKWAPSISGLVSLTAEINKDRRIEEDDYSDNAGNIQLAVYDISEPSILYPRDGLAINAQFKVDLADIGYYLQRNFKYEIQIDTSFSFENPQFYFKDLTGTNGLLKYPVPSLSQGRYFWRTRIFDGSNYGIWSEPRAFSSVDGNIPGYYYKGNLLTSFESRNLTFSKIYDGYLLNTELNPPHPDNERWKREYALGNIAALDTVGLTCITTDGKFVYLADYWYDVQKRNPDGKTKIYKVGTGRQGTNQGAYYGTIPNFREQIKFQMTYVNGYIYYPGDSPYILYKLDPNTGVLDSVIVAPGLLDFDFGDTRAGKFMIASYDGKIYNYAQKKYNLASGIIVRVIDPVSGIKIKDYEFPNTEPFLSLAGFFVVDDVMYMYEDYLSGTMMAVRLSDGKYLGDWLSWKTSIPAQNKRFYSWVYDEGVDEIYATGYRRNDSIPKTIAVFAGYYLDSKGKLISKPIGPVTKWKKLNYEIVKNNITSLYDVDLLGFNAQTRRWDTLRASVPNGYSLSQFSPQVYPYMRTVVSMEDTSYSTTNPMYVKMVHFDCETDLPELMITDKDFTFAPDSLLQGLDIDIKLRVANIGLIETDTVTAQLYLNNEDDPFYTTTFTIPADSSIVIHDVLNTTRTVFFSKVRAVVNNSGTELFTFNNIATDSFYVVRDTVKPDFHITFDGRELINGDIISNSPVIEMVLTDNSPLPLDTSMVSIVYNGKPVGFAKDSIQVSYTPYPNSKLNLVWHPVFKQGKHTVEVFTKDASDVPFSNISQKYQFYVYDEDDIQRIYNYPNPFTDETWFTFELRGNEPPDEVKIKVFTIAGRLIKEFEIPASEMKIGLNAIHWDGRDADGDEIANGVYLYKLITKYKDRTFTTIEKIAKVK